jgi:RNA ligase
MHYQFPYIEHIDQVLPYIQGAPEFVVVDKLNYKVINYVLAGGTTFPPINGSNDIAAIVRRECRGLIFSPDGWVISRRLHKFFNVNERAETETRKIDFSHPHRVTEKLDGSMITAIPMPDGTYRLGTKMGVTDVAMQAEAWLADNRNYHHAIEDSLLREATLIFEWCSRQQRIVVDYPQDRLVLIAIRDLYTGRYTEYEKNG